MPNQRAANKQQFGITFNKEDLAAIDAAAKAEGITRTEFILRAAKKYLEASENKKKK